MKFFSANLQFLVLVDDGKPRKKNMWCDSVVVFRARNLKHARARALRLGRAEEVSYKNYKDERIRWAFVGVDTIDEVGGKVDGAEVWARMYTKVSDKPVSPQQRFRPAKSKPGASGCSGLIE